MTNQPLLFDDAALLWARAQMHIAEYRREPPSWRFDEVRDLGTGDWLYGVTLDREALRVRKPIVSDIANNLVHALDQVLAACARIHGTTRSRIYYPIFNNDDRFDEALIKLSKSVGGEMLEVFRRVRDADPTRAHLATLKQLSNSAKHWALAPPTAAIDAVGIASPRGRVMVDVPIGHFDHSDHLPILRTHERLEHWATEILVGMRFSGLDPGEGADPMTVFISGSRHVATVLTQVTTLSGGPVFSPGPGIF